MSSNHEDTILGLPRRPRVADASMSTILWAIAGYYPAPRAAKVTFRYDPTAYWTVESVMPDDLQLLPEDRDDWLYGNLIQNQLPNVLPRVRRAS